MYYTLLKSTENYSVGWNQFNVFLLLTRIFGVKKSNVSAMLTERWLFLIRRMEPGFSNTLYIKRNLQVFLFTSKSFLGIHKNILYIHTHKLAVNSSDQNIHISELPDRKYISAIWIEIIIISIAVCHFFSFFFRCTIL